MIAQENLKQQFRQKPVQLLTTRREKWTLVLFTSIFIPLFLLFFQPFGVNNYDPTHHISSDLLIGTSIFGLFCGLTLGAYEFWLAPLLFHKPNWLGFLGRMILCLLLLDSVFFLCYNVLGNFHDWRLKSYFEFIQNLTVMGAIPMSITLLYLEYRKIRRAYEQARLSSLASKTHHKLIRLSSENGREHISLAPEHLLYIEAQGNYVFVYYQDNGDTRKSLLRTTMKKLERELNNYSIRRCHRSFLVNTERVNKVTGNAHQLLLHLSGLHGTIPVSRSYVPTLEEQLDVHPI